MHLIDDFLAWLWDPNGHRRMALRLRERRTDLRLVRLHRTEERAMDQVRRTQRFVRQHRDGWQ